MVAVTPRATAGLKLAAFALLLAAGWFVARATPAGEYFTHDGIVRLVEILRREWWAPLAFVLLYTLATALDFSGAALTFMGGAIFGFWWGSLLNLTGANLGANAAFWVARTLGREGITSLFGRRLAGLDRVSAEQGFGWLLRLRLIPIVPFNLLNFASGLTAMPWRTYAAATAIGIVPATLIYTYFADALLGVGGSHVEAHRVIVRLSIALTALVLLSFLPSIAKRAGWL
jgi:uncharacterized membrane protein YdjX (TVP38/TMEM64 family)